MKYAATAVMAGAAWPLLAMIPASGHVPRYAWDNVGNPLSVSRPSGSGHDATVAFGLDLATLMSSVTNENGECISRLVRDIPGRTVTDTGITGQDTLTRSDTAGRVTSVSRPDGVLVSNVLDVLGRSVEIRHDGTPVLGLAWRADDAMLAASNAVSSLVFSPDSCGLVVSETGNVAAQPAPAWQFSRAFDAATLPTGTTLSVGGSVLNVGHTYDSAGRLSSVISTAGTFALSYNALDGGLASVSGSAIAETQARDLLGHVTNITYKSTASGQTLASFDYRRDSTGLVTQKISRVDESVTTNRYVYDVLGRLTAVDGEAYAYDAAGNRLQRTGAPSASYTHNRLDGASHDAAGNVTSFTVGGVTRTLAWNTLGQLLSVSTNGVPAESYAYDPLGRRVSTTSFTPIPNSSFLTSNCVYHVYDGDHCAADTDASGNPIRVYAWGPGVDNLLAVTLISGATTNTYHAVKDHLGSVHALVDSSGSIAASYTYDAWGNILSTYSLLSAPYSLRFLWQGREYSYATGLYNFRARWYNPEWGRWLSTDPIGLEGGLNLYQFCENDPVNRIDPYGEDWLGAMLNASDAMAGFGDTISMGATSWFRETVFGDDYTDKCSGWYKGGKYAGIAHGLVAGGGRLLYVGLAKAGSAVLLRNGATAANAAKAVAMRNGLKNAFNLGLNNKKPLQMADAMRK